MLGLDLNGDVFAPSLVNGVVSAGLYGLIAVAMVLTFRVSRTVAFLHGGLVLMGAIFYWWLTTPNRFGIGGRPGLAPWVGTVIIVTTGAAIAGVYGLVVTGNRMDVRYTMKERGLKVTQVLTLASDGRSAHNSMKIRKFGIVVATYVEIIRKV